MRDGLARPVLWMVCGSFAFASMGALTHALGSRCDFALIALDRAAVMFVSSILLLYFAGIRPAVWRPRTLWVRSFAGSASLVCNFYALTRLPLADVLTLTNSYPLWIVPLAWISLGAVPAPRDILGVVCGLVGVVIIQRPHFVSGESLATSLALLSSVMTAVSMIGLHRLKTVDPRAVVAHFSTVATCVTMVWVGSRGMRSWTGSFELSTLVMLAGVGVTGTIGQVLLTKAYASGPPTQIAVVGLVQVVFALAFDVILWSRSIDSATWLGFLLVLSPTAWLMVREQRRESSDDLGEPAAPQTSSAATTWPD